MIDAHGQNNHRTRNRNSIESDRREESIMRAHVLKSEGVPFPFCSCPSLSPFYPPLSFCLSFQNRSLPFCPFPIFCLSPPFHQSSCGVWTICNAKLYVPLPLLNSYWKSIHSPTSAIQYKYTNTRFVLGARRPADQISEESGPPLLPCLYACWGRAEKRAVGQEGRETAHCWRWSMSIIICGSRR